MRSSSLAVVLPELGLARLWLSFSPAIIGCSKQSQAVDSVALIQAQWLNFTASRQLIARKGKYYKLQE